MKATKMISILIGICCWSMLFGQNFKQDIERINATYKATARYQMEMDYNLYVSHSSSQVNESTHALIIRNENGFYSKMFEQETIINQEYVILLDHDSKIFMIDHFQKGQINNSPQPLISNDSLMNMLKTISPDIELAIRDIEFSKGKYVVHYNYGELEMMTLYFDAASYQFQKVIMYYREAIPILENKQPQKPRLEIIYQNFDTNPNIPKELFSENKYAQIVLNKSLSPKGKMKDYTVINHLWRNHESQE